MDCTVVVAPPLGVSVSSKVDADQPSTPPATHNLPSFSGQMHSLPKIWHTTGTPAPAAMLQLQPLGERRTDDQSVDLWGTKK